MGIEKKDPANFSPSVEIPAKVDSFRFWCQKVLPLVYDDSLSYYELLCKVVNYLNNIIADVNTLGTDVDNLNNAYNELQSYVNNYFSTLDVQNEINNKLDVMAQDGSLSALIQPLFDTYKTEINDKVNQQNNKIGVLENRMNTFTNLPSGSTTGDAELIDIRVPASGFNNNAVYPNAGDAVRGQVDSLNKDLKQKQHIFELYKNDNIDLFNKYFIFDKYFDGTQFSTYQGINCIIVPIKALNVSGLIYENKTEHDLNGYLTDDSFKIITGISLPKNQYTTIETLDSQYFVANFRLTEQQISLLGIKDIVNELTDVKMLSEKKEGFFQYTNGVFISAPNYITYLYDNNYKDCIYEISSNVNNNAFAGVIYFDKDMKVIGYDMHVQSTGKIFKDKNIRTLARPKYIAFCGYVETTDNINIKVKPKEKELKIIDINSNFSNSFIMSDGSSIDSSQLRTITIPCNENDKFDYHGTVQFGNGLETYVLFKNSSGNIISFKNATKTGFQRHIITTPKNATSVTFNFINSYGKSICEVYKINGLIDTIEDWNIWEKVNLCINGDSVSTADVGRWVQTLWQSLPLNKYTNIAVGGNLITNQITSDERIAQIPSDTNVLLTGGMTNDMNGSVQIGSLETLDDTTTIYGALNTYFKKLNNLYPNTIICMNSNCYGLSTGFKNSIGLTMYDYAKAIKEVSELNSVYYIPVYEECGINQFNYKRYTVTETDSHTGQIVNVHPNIEGSQKMLTVILKYLTDIVKDNLK